MEHTKIVSPSELEDFSDRRDSEAVIPELVSRLVNLSVPDLTMCRIPYDDQIGLPGLDGIVRTESGFRQFVPKQTSLWEMGRSEGARDKATRDYTKRTKATAPEDRKAATFVFVTPRSKDWDQPSQTEWIQSRTNGGWREIKILDGLQLCDWLREFPSIGKWLLQRIGLVKSLTGFRTPGEHWENLAQLKEKGDPTLPAKVFMVGRENAIQQLSLLFERQTQQLILAAENEHDVEDFIAAYIESLDEPKRREHSGRCLFVSEPDAWQNFVNLQIPHVLVASPRLDLADSQEQLHMAARKRGHSVIVPILGARAHGAETVVPILSPSRTPLENALVEGGFSATRASELAGVGAQSLAALKRHLRGLGQIPPYASWENARLLAQATLIGEWKGDDPADREAIEILLGKSYGEWIEAIRGETLRADAPLIQRNEKWKVISRGEAWTALGPQVSDSDLDRVREVAVRVLGERDAQFDVPIDERQVRFMRGDSVQHSQPIRSGIAETVALLGTKSMALSSASIGKAEVTAKLIVRQLLRNSDWKMWASLNSEMPLLAEAAPSEFLEALEAGLSDRAANPFAQLFAQEETGLGGRNYMTGILWGLETLAWHPDYLGRVTQLLGDLDALDPGGSWGNRPRNSLVDIYLPWHIQTTADLPQRKAALDALLHEHPSTGWKLLLRLMPSSHGSTSGTRKPVWRPLVPRSWGGTTTTVEYWEQIRQYAQMCIELARNDRGKLLELTEQLPTLPEPAHSEILSLLNSPAILDLPETERRPLWETLRDVAAKHRRFAGADWALPPDRVVEIEKTADRLAPSAFDLGHMRLFTERDWDLYDGHDDIAIEGKKLDEKRLAAVQTILSSEGPEGILRFALKTEAPHKVGDALGKIPNTEVDTFFLPSHLNEGAKPLEQFLAGFIWSRYWSQNLEWVDRQLTPPWSHDQALKLFLRLPSVKAMWNRIAEELGSEEARYWKTVANIHPWGFSADDLLEAAENLTRHGQPAAAIDCLYILSEKKKELPMPLTFRALLGSVEGESQQRRIDHHHITEVIKRLQEQLSHDSDELFQIEWQFLPLLNRLHGAEPKALENRLTSSPAFFCEAVSLVFRSDNEDKATKREPTEAEVRIAKNAYSLLHGWRRIPGKTSNGGIDGRKFEEWLTEAKVLAQRSGHLAIAMNQLGQLLAHAPPDPEGLWIDRTIAKALDARDAAEMRSAFAVGLFNLRGIHGFTKGAEEAQIAASYRDKATALANGGFHRLADTVRGIAEDYERDAKRETQRDVFD